MENWGKAMDERPKRRGPESGRAIDGSEISERQRERLLAKLAALEAEHGSGTCWPYYGHRRWTSPEHPDPKAYPKIGLANAGMVLVVLARVVLAIRVGPLAAGCTIMHSCDNPRCINPDHLMVGRQKHNMQDKINKGRAGSPSTPEKWARMTAAAVARRKPVSTPDGEFPSIASAAEACGIPHPTAYSWARRGVNGWRYLG